MAQSAHKKNISSPDITRTFGKERVEILKLKRLNLARTTLEPGWQWSKHVKPISGGESCTVTFPSYILSGKIHVKMDKGEEVEYESGDAFELEEGYDAWTLGKQPCVILSFSEHRMLKKMEKPSTLKTSSEEKRSTKKMEKEPSKMRRAA